LVVHAYWAAPRPWAPQVAKSITGHLTDSVYERYHVVREVVREEDQRAPLARVEAGFTTNQHKRADSQHSRPVPARM